MEITKAMQQAENGKLIQNHFMKMSNCFLKYMGFGVFYEYKIENKKAVYKYEVRSFSFGEILTNSWEVIEDIYF